MSRTRRALEMMAEGMKQNDAARAVGVSRQAVSAARRSPNRIHAETVLIADEMANLKARMLLLDAEIEELTALHRALLVEAMTEAERVRDLSISDPGDPTVGTEPEVRSE